MSWRHILANPCIFWDRECMIFTMKEYLILHSMVVDMRRNGYESEIWELVKDEAKEGMFFGENGEAKVLKWGS